MSDIRIVNLSGDDLACLPSVDVDAINCGELKHKVARAVGFSHLRIMVSIAGVPLVDDSAPLKNLVGEGATEGPVTVSCTLVPNIACIKKGERRGMMNSKMGPIVMRHAQMAALKGETNVFTTERAPKESEDWKYARQLIGQCFARGLSDLIDAIFQAAHTLQVEQPEESKPADFVYEDIASGLHVDMSSCQLWLRKLHEPFISGQRELGVPSAIVWRLLHGWEGTSEDTELKPSAGPVCEVLFLATTPADREGGHGRTLVAELEKAATEMGCRAIVVAAVPRQGHGFWLSLGYSIAVGLKETPSNLWAEYRSGAERPANFTDNMQAAAASGVTASRIDPTSSPHVMPDTAFGSYLHENMLLFTDTPLVAKVLKAEVKPCECKTSVET